MENVGDTNQILQISSSAGFPALPLGFFLCLLKLPTWKIFLRRNTFAMFVQHDFSDDRTCKMITPSVHHTFGSYPGGRNEAGISGDPAVPACMLRYPVRSVSVGIHLGFDSPIALGAILVEYSIPSSYKFERILSKQTNGQNLCG